MVNLEMLVFYNDANAMKAAHESRYAMFSLLTLPLPENTFVAIIFRWAQKDLEHAGYPNIQII